MVNKDIEELLNDIKEQVTIDEKLGKEIAKDFHKTTLNYKEIKILLSYIEQLEQLEKRNKQLYEGFMATQEELTDYATENEKLKKQKDDVVEYVNSIVFEENFTFVRERAEVKYAILRMLGEIDDK